jgi:O-methyltransferase
MRSLTKIARNIHGRCLYRRYGTRSMLGQRLFTENVMLAQRHLEKSGIRGCYVECGTWAGGLSFAMMDALPQITEFHLFDSFEGLPEPTQADGKEAFDPTNLWHDGNKADFANFMQALRDTGHRNVTVQKGWFEDTLPGFRPKDPVAILRLDGDWYESTMTCLKYLYGLVSEGGLIIVDDYDDWVGCRKALHDFLSESDASESIRRSPRGVVYLVKERRKAA